MDSSGNLGITNRGRFGSPDSNQAESALILIWLIASWSLRPLARALEEAGRIGPRHPDARLSRARLPAEILPLVDAVNGALDRMTSAFAAERRFTENAAHELRTPLP